MGPPGPGPGWLEGGSGNRTRKGQFGVGGAEVTSLVGGAWGPSSGDAQAAANDLQLRGEAGGAGSEPKTESRWEAAETASRGRKAVCWILPALGGPVGVGLESGGWILCCRVHCGRQEEAEWMRVLEAGRPVRNPLQQTRGGGGVGVGGQDGAEAFQGTGF